MAATRRTSGARATAAPLLTFERPQSLAEIDVSELTARESYDGVLVDGGDASGVDLSAVSFTECELASLVFTDTLLRGARFVDTLLGAPFAPSLLASRTTWRRAQIESPRWGSAELYDSEFDSVRIVGGKIDYLNLRGSKLVNVVIENCTITELDVGGATLERVALRDCRVDALDVTGTRATAFDLRTSEFGRLTGIEGLRGALIDDLQLSLFSGAMAEHLGITVL